MEYQEVVPSCASKYKKRATAGQTENRMKATLEPSITIKPRLCSWSKRASFWNSTEMVGMPVSCLASLAVLAKFQKNLLIYQQVKSTQTASVKYGKCFLSWSMSGAVNAWAEEG